MQVYQSQWNQQCEDQGGLIYAIVHWSCVSQPIYAIIPHNVVCAVVVFGFAVDILLIPH